MENSTKQSIMQVIAAFLLIGFILFGILQLINDATECTTPEQCKSKDTKHKLYLALWIVCLILSILLAAYAFVAY